MYLIKVIKKKGICSTEFCIKARRLTTSLSQVVFVKSKTKDNIHSKNLIPMTCRQREIPQASEAAEHTYRNPYQNSYGDACGNSNRGLFVMFRCEESRILQSSQSLRPSADEIGLAIREEGTLPPTTVSWAPRRMALGSKFLTFSLLFSSSCVMIGFCDLDLPSAMMFAEVVQLLNGDT